MTSHNSKTCVFFFSLKGINGKKSMKPLTLQLATYNIRRKIYRIGRIFTKRKTALIEIYPKEAGLVIKISRKRII